MHVQYVAAGTTHGLAVSVIDPSAAISYGPIDASYTIGTDVRPAVMTSSNQTAGSPYCTVQRYIPSHCLTQSHSIPAETHPCSIRTRSGSKRARVLCRHSPYYRQIVFCQEFRLENRDVNNWSGITKTYKLEVIEHEDGCVA